MKKATPAEIVRDPLVAIYARVSTEDQRCDLQLDACREFTLNRSWKIYAEYVDTGFSGAKAERPQLLKLMRDARARKFDCIVVWKLDRFGRSVSNFLAHMQDLAQWGVRFIVATQAIDTDQASPTSKLLLHIFAAFAEFERAMIQERVKAGMRAAKNRGVKAGRRPGIFDRARVVELRNQGYSYLQIQRAMGLSHGTVQRTLEAASSAAMRQPTA
jgi:DNA invertase Pin-like site-specific DNA recombinase